MCRETEATCTLLKVKKRLTLGRLCEVSRNCDPAAVSALCTSHPRLVAASAIEQQQRGLKRRAGTCRSRCSEQMLDSGPFLKPLCLSRHHKGKTWDQAARGFSDLLLFSQLIISIKIPHKFSWSPDMQTKHFSFLFFFFFPSSCPPCQRRSSASLPTANDAIAGSSRPPLSGGSL